MKKLQGNGLFESSRMMLPEHKEAYLEHQAKLDKKSRAPLDEQEVERLSRIIAESLQFQREVTVVLVEEAEERNLTGRVIKIDQQRGIVKLAQGGDAVWVKVADVIDIRF